MRIIDTPIADLLVIEPKVWKDDRGYFYESFREDFFKEINIDLSLVQDNQSLSQRDVADLFNGGRATGPHRF